MFWNKNKKENIIENKGTEIPQSLNLPNFENQSSIGKDPYDDLKIPIPEEFGLDVNQPSADKTLSPSPAAPVQEVKKKSVFKGLFGTKKEKQAIPIESISLPQMPPLSDLEIPNMQSPYQKESALSSQDNQQFTFQGSDNKISNLGEIPSPETISIKEDSQVNIPEPIKAQEQNPLADPNKNENKNEISDSKGVTEKTKKTKKETISKKPLSEAEMKESEVKAEIALQKKVDKKIESSNFRKDRLLKEMLDDIEKELENDRKDIDDAAKIIKLIEKELGHKNLKNIISKRPVKKPKNKKVKKSRQKPKKSKKKTVKKSVKAISKKKAAIKKKFSKKSRKR